MTTKQNTPSVATPRPWKAVNHGSWIGQVMAQRDGENYGICKCAGETPEEKSANAELIVQAVNSYGALMSVAALHHCLVTSPRFQSMNVADAIAELRNNGCDCDDALSTLNQQVKGE